MRVKVDNFGKPPYFGELVGLLAPDSCDRCGSDSASAVVRADGFGLYLHVLHPSRVSLVTPEKEERYKP